MVSARGLLHVVGLTSHNNNNNNIVVEEKKYETANAGYTVGHAYTRRTFRRTVVRNDGRVPRRRTS